MNFKWRLVVGKELNFNVYDVMYMWFNSSGYSVKLIDEDGNHVSNIEVLFSIIGKSFKSTTNEFGIASVGISLE